MAIILTKKSDTASSVPLAADLTNAAGGAELAVNTADKRLYSKTSGGAVVELGTNPSVLTLPNGTANAVPYLNGSKVLTSGSALTFDGTGLSVTGTSTATLKLNGRASDNGSSANFYDNTGATRYGFIYFDASTAQIASTNTTPLAFLLNGSEQMRLTSTGLGIGTSSITAIYGGKTVQLQSASGATSYITTGTYNAFMAATTDGKAHFGTSTGSTSVVFETANGTALTIDPSNNVGIGTSSPGGKLDVLTDSGIHLLLSRNTPTQSPTYIKSNADFSNLTLQAGSTAGYFSAVEVMGWNGSGNTPRVAFYTAGTEKMRLDTSGNLGIGTSSPGAKLELVGGSGKVFAANTTVSTPTNVSIQIGGFATTSNSGSFIKSYVNLGSNLFSSLAFEVNGGALEAARFDSSGNFIHQVNGAAPTLATNSTMSFELTSNTSLKIVVRGTDGVTRSVSLTLA